MLDRDKQTLTTFKLNCRLSFLWVSPHELDVIGVIAFMLLRASCPWWAQTDEEQSGPIRWRTNQIVLFLQVPTRILLKPSWTLGSLVWHLPKNKTNSPIVLYECNGARHQVFELLLASRGPLPLVVVRSVGARWHGSQGLMMRSGGLPRQVPAGFGAEEPPAVAPRGVLVTLSGAGLPEDASVAKERFGVKVLVNVNYVWWIKGVRKLDGAEWLIGLNQIPAY